MLEPTVQDEPKTVQSTMLVITGGALDPAAVTVSLRLQPHQVWRKGEKKSIKMADGRLRELPSIHEWSGWKHWLEEPFTNLDVCAQLKHWVQMLKPQSAALSFLKQNGAAVVIDCFICTSEAVGIEVPATLQAELGALGIDLELNFYAHQETSGSNAV
jgi:uncharacterized protein DUF4279